MKNMTLEAFIALTESDAPAPGGGSVAALAGALGAALAGMVANLTIGKEKFLSVEKQMIEMEAKAKALAARLLDAISEDSESFGLYMDALKLPKETDTEKLLRKEAMQNGLKEASKVPFHTAQLAYEVMDYAQLAVEYGNQNAVTDGKTAAMMARTAVLCAGMNVRINLDSIKDQEFVTNMKEMLTLIEEKAIQRESEILGW